jgi:hypothetical protein
MQIRYLLVVNNSIADTDKYLHLSNLKLIDINGNNVAIKAQVDASQSSTFPPFQSTNFDAYQAFENNLTYSHTTNTMNKEWWRLDLRESKDIIRIEINNIYVSVPTVSRRLKNISFHFFQTYADSDFSDRLSKSIYSFKIGDVLNIDGGTLKHTLKYPILLANNNILHTNSVNVTFVSNSSGSVLQTDLSLNPINVGQLSIVNNNWSFKANANINTTATFFTSTEMITSDTSYNSSLYPKLPIKYLGILSDTFTVNTLPITVNILSITVSPTLFDYSSLPKITVQLSSTATDFPTNNIITFNPSGGRVINWTLIGTNLYEGNIDLFPKNPNNTLIDTSINVKYIDVSMNYTFQSNTYIPKIINANAVLTTINYYDTSGVISLQFDKNLIVDLSLNHIIYDASLQLSSVTKKSSTEFDIKFIPNGRYDAMKTFQCSYYGVTTDISLNVNGLFPVITDISFNKQSILFDDRALTPTLTFNKPLLPNDEQMIGSIDISKNNIDVSSNRTKVSFTGDLNYNIKNNNKSISFTYNGITYTSPTVAVDTTIPTLDISLSSVENLLYTDVSSQVVLKLNDSSNYLYRNSLSIPLANYVTVDPSLLTLTMNSLESDGFYRGSIVCASGCYYPTAKLRFAYQENPITIDSSFVFRVDTRQYKTTMSCTKPSFNYQDVSGILSIQLDPFVPEFGTDVSMSNFSLYRNDESVQPLLILPSTIKWDVSNAQIELKSNGSFSASGQWQSVLSISGEINTVIKIKYNETIIPLRNDGVLEYREDELYIDVVKIIPRISDISLNKTIYFDTKEKDVLITFDYPLLNGDESNIQLIDLDTTNYSITDLISISSTQVSCKYNVLNYEVYNANKTIQLSFRGRTKDVSNILVDTRVPTLNNSLSLVENLLYTDISSQVVLTLNDTTKYFKERYPQLLAECVTVDASLLTLTMNPIQDDGIYRGTITYQSGCYYPNAKLRFLVQQNPIAIDSLFVFRVDTRPYTAVMTFSKSNLNYTDSSGIVTLQLQPVIDDEMDVSLNDFSLLLNNILIPITILGNTISSNSTNPQLQLTSLGSMTTVMGIWQGICSISTDYVGEIKIKYKEELQPRRDDFIVQYRESQDLVIGVNLNARIVDVSVNSRDKDNGTIPVLTYLETSCNVLITFDRTISNPNITSLISVDSSAIQLGIFSPINFERTQWQGKITASPEISQTNVHLICRDYNNMQTITTMNIMTKQPSVQEITMASPIDYMNLSSSISVLFANALYDICLNDIKNRFVFTVSNNQISNTYFQLSPQVNNNTIWNGTLTLAQGIEVDEIRLSFLLSAMTLNNISTVFPIPQLT